MFTRHQQTRSSRNREWGEERRCPFMSFSSVLLFCTAKPWQCHPVSVTNSLIYHRPSCLMVLSQRLTIILSLFPPTALQARVWGGIRLALRPGKKKKKLTGGPAEERWDEVKRKGGSESWWTDDYVKCRCWEGRNGKRVSAQGLGLPEGAENGCICNSQLK